MNLALALGVAAATAVLVGALLVGDSVKGSLRKLTVDRLGRIDELLVVDRFFREELVDQLTNSPQFQQDYERAAGAVLLAQGTAERRQDANTQRASNVAVLGSDGSTFWDFDTTGTRPQTLPDMGEVVLNQPLAEELQAKIGDEVTLRLPKPEDIPADSPLGEKTDRIRSLPRLKVVDIVEAKGLGGFALRASQVQPYNAYVALPQLQESLRQPNRINAILVAGKDTATPPDESASESLAAALRPTASDLGLAVKRVRLAHVAEGQDDPQTVYDYFSISSQRMILPPEVRQAASQAMDSHHGQPVLVYLANMIQQASAESGIPYSMVAAIDFTDEFPLHDTNGNRIAQLGPNEMVLNSWAAENLRVKAGDDLDMTFFEPETTHGETSERTASFRLKAITPLTAPVSPYLPSQKHDFEQPPTLANDPDLTPEVEGVTDQESIDDWEVPFTIDYSLVRSEDDEYWEYYGTTPKAFVSYDTGKRLWGSRFGDATSYRVPASEGLSVQQVERLLLEHMAKDGATLGFDFRPIKRRQLDASSGNTPFNVLFISLSFFIIAAALMLVALLFRLNFERRCRETGLLLASGWQRRRVWSLALAEGLCVAAIGAALGLAIGVGYAWLILAALSSKSWWLGAVSSPFLEFHWTITSLLVGYVSGLAISAATILLSTYLTRRVAARQLLAGHVSSGSSMLSQKAVWPQLVAALLVVCAVVLAFFATKLGGQAQAGAFVGAGAAILAALVLAIWNQLRSGAAAQNWNIVGRLPLVRMAMRGAARNPSRSALTIGLIATASFLIVAMSAFRMDPSESGTGGFELVGESSQPIFADLNDQLVRDDLLASLAEELAGTQVYAFRVQPGDDASCGNLYQAAQPRVLGVSPEFVERFDDPLVASFAFSASAAGTDKEQQNPWRMLGSRTTSDGDEIPVVIDKDTAMYSLHLYKGIGQTFDTNYQGRKVTFRVVGLLGVSVLHGSLLIGEADFRRLFPTIDGYRQFLIETPEGQADKVAALLEDTLGDQGFDASDSEKLLVGLLAIQNTYLRTFQSLGALGLLLGTFGLATVQLRNILERRGELALLRATGFRKVRLAQMVLFENLFLLVTGLLAGVGAALIAVLPHVLSGGAAVPWGELAALLSIVLLVGVLAGLIASLNTLRAPLLSALREER
jgi:ABC-type antimicrobial peptide transport system permease subunit